MQRFLIALTTALLACAAQSETTDYQILLIGNSHSSGSKLPELLATLIEAGAPDSTARARATQRWKFLADRLDDNVTQKLLDSEPWTHVILQAQKYSSSGKYFYPTDAAEEWIRRIRERDATPILFPEWARRDNTEEWLRIHKLHLSIASREPACVAPIGVAWALIVQSNPSVRLHASDGNHSNSNGALLTAYVLYQAVTGEAADGISDLDSLRASPELQKTFRDAATEAHRMSPGCPE